MSEPSYTIKEIMDIQFKGLDQKLDYITQTLKDQNTNSTLRFTAVETDLDKVRAEMSALREEQAKYKTVWGIGATVGASLVAFFLNRIF